MRRLVMIWTSPVVFLAACTSTPEPTLEQAPISEPIVTTAEKNSSAKKVDWREFFKPSPSVAEQRILLERLSKWPDVSDPDKLLERARSEVAVGKVAAAEATFSVVLRYDENNLEALLGLSQILITRRQLAKAGDLLHEIEDILGSQESKDESFVVRYRYALANYHLISERFVEGRDILSSIIGQYSDFAPAYEALARTYLMQGNEELAEFVITRAFDAQLKDAALYNIQGLIFQMRKEYTKARMHYEESLKVNPNYAPALVNRGNLSMIMGEFAAAEKDLLDATTKDPNLTSGFVTLGILQRKMGRYPASKATLLRALEINPEDGYARYNLGILMASHFKDKHQALRLFNEVLQAKDSDESIKRSASLYIDEIMENDKI